jgi:phage FluMu protein Com
MPDFKEVRCIGNHKDRDCGKLLFKTKQEGEAVVVEIKCPTCNEYLIKKFRARRNKCETIKL